MLFKIWMCVASISILLLNGCGGSPGMASPVPAVTESPAAWEANFSQHAKDAQGWSILTPSADSRLIYVSSAGNDSTAKFYLPSDSEIGNDPFNPTGTILPYATITAALAQTRNNTTTTSC